MRCGWCGDVAALDLSAWATPPCCYARECTDASRLLDDELDAWRERTAPPALSPRHIAAVKALVTAVILRDSREVDGDRDDAADGWMLFG